MIFKRRRQVSPRVKLLELAVATRYAVSRLGLQAARLRAAYQRTRDKTLLKMLENIVRLQAVLEVLSVRLETLAQIGTISSEDLYTVKQIIADLKSAYGDIAPGISSMLADLENTVTSIASLTGLEILTTGVTVADENARRILEEAELIARQRLEELMRQT
ncbi:hypothetical protein [Hyperthermus butylicus]|uniref:Conserved crenarchaeal protein n=1 Tax=Hyperthermus butylicus (strain DSM 5456 / JCM 9403 / PLM1-5) TaxID=415426 RepID=A2BM29_HYPBU|nr:hypothetical protein [Hyperthermus butylicus]ABM81040.1 conserved crenarchaeal protein [Hyperthermus butylicus DSM 5456]